MFHHTWTEIFELIGVGCATGCIGGIVGAGLGRWLFWKNK